jgi:hypothetical protein
MSARLIPMIHVAAKALGLDEDTRRDLQLRVTGKASLRDMSAAEQTKVLDALKQQGFKPVLKGSFRKPASRGDVRFAHVLFGKLYQAGKVNVGGAEGLNLFIRARFSQAWGAAPIDIDRMTDPDQIAAVIEALKAMCRRSQIDISQPRDKP